MSGVHAIACALIELGKKTEALTMAQTYGRGPANRTKDAHLKSYGFLLRSKGQYLLGHSTTTKSWTQGRVIQFDSNWTIPKGMPDFPDERGIDVAVRELKEEVGIGPIGIVFNAMRQTNIDLDSEKLKPLLPDSARDTALPKYTYKTGRGKQVNVFFIDDPKGLLREVELSCPSIIKDATGSLSGLNGAPEIDCFTFADWQEAERMVFESQRFMFKTE
ncbi:hypothetical protein PROFUN_07410 [Planoprotostelium fungivorum]|uniref:Nudix hydrolase domain-containing protein n=1 Tax=Planoprotostelium fungivorum TaxID=1890364 RepID=A0A2P6MTK1_9EUKA|nr:hypothetical protein PROFUN_07410 [Planoprotostelium fungivorum]